jgi:hypothetical protein
MEITTTLHKTENPDSLEIGTPSKGGAIKVYCDFFNPDAAKAKVDNAILVRDYANRKIGNPI